MSFVFITVFLIKNKSIIIPRKLFSDLFFKFFKKAGWKSDKFWNLNPISAKKIKIVPFTTWLFFREVVSAVFSDRIEIMWFHIWPKIRDEQELILSKKQ